MNDRREALPRQREDGFVKITPCNGFDCADPNNAMQNNYSWSMAELGEYLYVGTGRNITYQVLKSGQFGSVPVPPILTPNPVDTRAEIWRYKTDGTREWERVFKSGDELGITGFRYMIRYTTPDGETALYAGAATAIPGIVIVKSTDGVNWLPLRTDIPGNSTRAMAVHEGRLYMGVLLQNELSTMLYVSTDPERSGWQPVDLGEDPTQNPRGAITVMTSHNSHLYLGTTLPGGFEVWRTTGSEPERDGWKLVVDKGAGDALNQIPLSIGVFRDLIYVGSALFGIRSIDPGGGLVPPKGFDVIRVYPDDRWELIIGGPPVEPTEPTTGTRGQALSGRPSGFGNITNAYCWQLQAQGDQLYLGTFDWAVLLPHTLPGALENLGAQLPFDPQNYLTVLNDYLDYLRSINPILGLLPAIDLEDLPELLTGFLGPGFGFDLWRSSDGVEWTQISLNGFANQFNYGVRKLFLSENGRLYLGTANPFQGTEVWVR